MIAFFGTWKSISLFLKFSCYVIVFRWHLVLFLNDKKDKYEWVRSVKRMQVQDAAAHVIIQVLLIPVITVVKRVVSHLTNFEWSPGGRSWGERRQQVLNGSEPKYDQRAFMYREENGVKSVLLDDNNCDCLSTLSLGHGMCHNGSRSASVNSFGVDTLYEPSCQSPRSGIGLTLYVRRKTPN